MAFAFDVERSHVGHAFMWLPNDKQHLGSGQVPVFRIALLVCHTSQTPHVYDTFVFNIPFWYVCRLWVMLQ